ncbi:MAG: hypothetical protein AB1568_04490 [Thermodesulfobacteriota bacterium]
MKWRAPLAAAKTHLLLAGLVWSGVGLLLFARGLAITGGVVLPWSVVAVAVGTAKALFLLDRTARRNIRRIVTTRDNTCIGGVYSWQTWMLVLVMIGSGWLLRHGSLPAVLVGSIYVGIGWALLLSSRLAWMTWFSGNVL